MRWHTEQQQQQQIYMYIQKENFTSLVSLNTHLDSEVPT